ncbi:peroxisomal membrane protein PEX14-like [Schistocerca gregaria]|uniref:peroxisomal membrane protein PEX14-like n=1 Tax=Schistocerca gregaria TaxID=7010 RepID=UPI00211E25DA|nr:peroxisomal membrane protein PEX14-like [Schistocerca gregaria]
MERQSSEEGRNGVRNDGPASADDDTIRAQQRPTHEAAKPTFQEGSDRFLTDSSGSDSSLKPSANYSNRDNHSTNTKLNSVQSAPQQPLRENMIDAAVAFLKNPRIKSSPLDQKISFLLQKKGLTEAELEIALTRAGFSNSTRSSRESAANRNSEYGSQSRPPSNPSVPHYVPYTPATNQGFLSLRAIGLIVFVCMSIHSVVSYLIKKFMARFYWPEKSTLAQRITALEAQVRATERLVSSQVGEFLEALNLVKKCLKIQKKEYEDSQKLLVLQQEEGDYKLSELKKSISTLRHLLPTIPTNSQLSTHPSNFKLQNEYWAEVKNELQSLKNTIKLLSQSGQLKAPARLQPLTTSKAIHPELSPTESPSISSNACQTSTLASVNDNNQNDKCIPESLRSPDNFKKIGIPPWQREQTDSSSSPSLTLQAAAGHSDPPPSSENCES